MSRSVDPLLDTLNPLPDDIRDFMDNCSFILLLRSSPIFFLYSECPNNIKFAFIYSSPYSLLFLVCSIIPSMAESNQDHKLHIAMFPWLAFGHIIPYLELAKLFAGKGHKISFISTPRNIHRLPKLPPNIAPRIDFITLPLPHVHNLPQNAEATSDLPYDAVVYLKLAYDLLQEPITHFLKSRSPNWVLFDFAAYWIAPIASELGIHSSFFSISLASSVCLAKPTSPSVDMQDDRLKPEDFTVPPKWVPFVTKTVSFRLFEVLKIFDSAVAGDDRNVSDFFRLENTIRSCDSIVVRGCLDFDGKWLHLLEKIHGKPIFPAGQLPTTDYDSGGDAGTWRWIKEWLDKQQRGSVVYVAFGSEAKPSQNELTELALGLELSGLPFFWALKTRLGEVDTELLVLPDGFEERTRGRGVVNTSWVPQLKILSHDSVGGMLTHSGWSSVVEAFHFQRPLILLACHVDQGINARLLEEKELAYSIPRNEVDGSFTRNSVAESLVLVMVKEEGKCYRDKAKEMSELFGDKDRQNRYADNFLDYVKSHHQRPTKCQ
ncbi:UDP-glycosyltransferase 91A1-like [Tripterygium wilfordii]|uniref:UDP-glycosyltransferase 91A1-like n=1 Tax=Tripterygium wilfordii TaxID=458696 RepID=UPI0018F7F4D8|nr:UDP-glycosyltransferase 91A1-like [Tripterygium wilfordii]